MGKSAMLSDIGRFIKERFPLPVALPLTLILFAGPASVSPPGLGGAIFGWVNTFLALLCLRMADDLTSLPTDKISHPERGLPAGRLEARNLRNFLALAVSAMVLWQVNIPAMLAAIGTVIFYVLFFRDFKEKLPLLTRPFFSNIIFAVIPCYAGIMGGNLTPAHLWLAVFIWLAAVAHELAHNVHGPLETDLGLADYVESIGARSTAALALVLFALAGFFAFLAWLSLARPWVFGLLLVLTAAHLGFLGAKLIREPEYENARPFYVAGFTFFLVPLAGLLIDRLLVLGLG